MTRAELAAVLAFIQRTRAPAIDGLGIRAEDPIWSMVLFLLRRHLAHQMVTISGLAAASGIPYATAMRRIGELFEAGLLARRPRGRSGRSFSIEPTPELLARVEALALAVKARVGETLGLSADRPTGYYFGGAYLAARIIPPPEPQPGIGRDAGTLRLLLKRQPSFNALVRLRGTLQQLIGCRMEATVLELEELLARLLDNATATESAFDILSINFGWLGELVAAGALLPLDDRLAKLRPGIFDFYPSTWERAQHRGRQYGLPIEPTAELLCWRRDLFEAAGVAAPATVEAVLAAGRRLQRPSEGLWGIAWNAARGQALGQTFVHTLATFGQPPLRLRRFGGHIDMSDASGEALRPALDTAEALATAEYLLALLDISPPDILEMDWDRRLRAFAGGQVAMAYNWSSRIAEIELDPAATASGRTAYLPHPAPSGGRPAAAPVGGFALAIPANLSPARIELAWRAVQWLTSPAMAKLIAINGAWTSPRFSVAADPEVLAASPIIATVDGLARAGQLLSWSTPPVAELNRMLLILGEELHPMLTREVTPATALASAQARIDAMMRAAGHY